MDVKRRYCTVRQQEIMLNFLQKHPDLALGLERSKEGRARAALLWQKCARLANSEGPPRTPRQWLKYWHDLKWKVRTKTAVKPTTSSSNVSTPAPLLTAIEIKAANIMGIEVNTLHVQNERTPLFPQQLLQEMQSNEQYTHSTPLVPLAVIKDDESQDVESDPLQQVEVLQDQYKEQDMFPQEDTSLHQEEFSQRNSIKDEEQSQHDESIESTVLRIEEIRAANDRTLALALQKQAEAAVLQAKAMIAIGQGLKMIARAINSRRK